jgi:hypothetical protein
VELHKALLKVFLSLDPNDSQQVDGHFTNDNDYFLTISQEMQTLENTMDYIQIFCETSKSNVQMYKTKCY